VPYLTAVTEARALAGGQLDAAYLDPVEAAAVWQAGGDRGIAIVAGSASGGAELVARPGVTSVAQLAGERLAASAGTGGRRILRESCPCSLSS
jgi:NitT/TauT family transport system substrate-binding protein